MTQRLPRLRTPRPQPAPGPSTRSLRSLLIVGAVAVLITAAACNRSGTKDTGSASDTTATSTDTTPPGNDSASALTVPNDAPAAPAQKIASSVCRAGNPLANVYHPDRLEVISSCRTVTGVVQKVTHETDGDYHINIRLDPKYAGMVNMANNAYENGALVAEIIPADEPGCTKGNPPIMPYGTYDYGVCTGADIPAPPVGAHVSATGPYVIDHAHGWLEIHPVWRLVRLSQTGTTAHASPARSLAITSISPNPVNPGQYITLTAQTSAGSSCGITVTYASGHVSSASGLGSKTASGSGRVSWTWKVGTSTGAGNATARVSCGGLSAQKTFRVT